MSTENTEDTQTVVVQNIEDEKESNLRILADILVGYRWVLVLVGVVVLIGVALWGFNVKIPPEIQNRLVEFGVYLVAGSLISVPAALLIVYLRDDWSGTPILSLHPVKSGVKVGELGEEKLRDLTIVNPQGEVVDLEDCKTVWINGQKGKEVLAYDVEQNIGMTTWMADASAIEMRASRSVILYTMYVLSAMADEAIESRANVMALVRKCVIEIWNRQIAIMEGEEIPGGGKIRDVINDVVRNEGYGDITEWESEIEESVPDKFKGGLHEDARDGFEKLKEEEGLQIDNPIPVSQGDSDE